jgi:hypothetical protein
VAIAAGLTVLGVVAGILSGGAPAPVPSSTPTAPGSPIHAIAARPDLSTIFSGGLPPSDILTALALPRGTEVTPGSARNEGVGLYDQSITFSVQASEKDVIAFFRAQLPAGRWKILGEGASSSVSTGSPSGAEAGYRILGQHPGGNGYEWELGVTVMPETFSSPASVSAGSAGKSSAGGSAQVAVTPFTFRLFEVDDTS